MQKSNIQPRKKVVFSNGFGGYLRIPVLMVEGNSTPVAEAIVLCEENNNEECILWDIRTGEEYFRKGYATELLKGIQNEYNNIVTQWRTKEGEKLCLKNGFEYERTPKGQTVLVWRKEKYNAKKEKE